MAWGRVASAAWERAASAVVATAAWEAWATAAWEAWATAAWEAWATAAWEAWATAAWEAWATAAWEAWATVAWAAWATAAWPGAGAACEQEAGCVQGSAHPAGWSCAAAEPAGHTHPCACASTGTPAGEWRQTACCLQTSRAAATAATAATSGGAAWGRALRAAGDFTHSVESGDCAAPLPTCPLTAGRRQAQHQRDDGADRGGAHRGGPPCLPHTRTAGQEGGDGMPK